MTSSTPERIIHPVQRLMERYRLSLEEAKATHVRHHGVLRTMSAKGRFFHSGGIVPIEDGDTIFYAAVVRRENGEVFIATYYSKAMYDSMVQGHKAASPSRQTFEVYREGEKCKMKGINTGKPKARARRQRITSAGFIARYCRGEFE